MCVDVDVGRRCGSGNARGLGHMIVSRGDIRLRCARSHDVRLGVMKQRGRGRGFYRTVSILRHTHTRSCLVSRYRSAPRMASKASVPRYLYSSSTRTAPTPSSARTANTLSTVSNTPVQELHTRTLYSPPGASPPDHDVAVLGHHPAQRPPFHVALQPGGPGGVSGWTRRGRAWRRRG